MYPLSMWEKPKSESCGGFLTLQDEPIKWAAARHRYTVGDKLYLDIQQTLTEQ